MCACICVYGVVCELCEGECVLCVRILCVGGLCIFHACVDCEWVEAVCVSVVGDCVSVCLCVGTVGGLLNILVDVAFPPLL